MKLAVRGLAVHIPVFLLLIFLLGGCALQGQEGSIILSFGAGRMIYSPENLDVAEYEITFSGPGGRTISRTITPALSGETSVTVDSLAAGEWTITVNGYNSDGVQVAYLQKNGSGRRDIVAFVQRAKTTAVTAVMVAYAEGSGTLLLEIDWSDVSDELLQKSPAVMVALDHLGEISLADAEAQLGGSGYTLEIADTGVYTLTPASPEAGVSVPLTLTGLPAGVYEVTVSLKTEDGQRSERNWQGVYFSRVVDTLLTEVPVTVLESRLETGSIYLEVEENMLPLNPLLESLSGAQVTLDGEGEAAAHFISSGVFESPVYLWYINGDKVSGVSSNELTWIFTEEGSYTVTVLVLDNGRWGAQTLPIEVLLAEGSRGPAGGVIVATGTEFSGFRYLEAAPPEGGMLLDWPAAGEYCSSYSFGGYGDWYLPSIEELEQMLESLSVSEGLSGDRFWSSSESDAESALSGAHDGEFLSSADDKSQQLLVRPVRVF